MILEVSNLRVAFRMEGRLSVPVRDVSFGIPANGRVALVGESGSGKSLTALAAYMVVFCICAVAYLIGWVIMKALVPKYKPIVVED